MPTSSQALISFNMEVSERNSPRSNVCIHRDPAPITVAAVYSLSGCVPLNKTSVEDYQAVAVLGRESAQLFKHHDLPKGYTSILAFDKKDKEFHWQALGGLDDSGARPYNSFCDSQCPTYDNDKVSLEHRPCSVALDGSKPKSETHVKFVDADLYEKLIQLGFRPSALALKDGSQPMIGAKRAKSLKDTENKKNESQVKTSEAILTSTTADVTIRDMHTSHITPDSQADDPVLTRPPDQFSDEEDAVDEEYFRIRPSVHMRKELPETRPLSVIFSFRDNEDTSHADVKFLFETKIKVRVKTIQYDALHVRAAKPDIRSRWIVELTSKDDLNKVLKEGLIIGRDKLIMYKYDDIAKREVSTFKYYASVKSAQKKLTGSKSLKKVGSTVRSTARLRKAVSEKVQLVKHEL